MLTPCHAPRVQGYQLQELISDVCVQESYIAVGLKQMHL